MDASSQLRKGLFWLGGGSVVARLIDVASVIIVMRFLSREEMGLATLAWTVTVFVESFNGLGMHAALVQTKEIDVKRLSSVYWYVFVVTLLLTSIVFISANVVSYFYDNDALVWMIRFSSLKILFVGLANVPRGLLSRAFKFKELGVIFSFSALGASLGTIFSAVIGLGAWAPLVGNTVHGLFQLLGVYLFGAYFPKKSFSWEEVKPLSSFGIKVAASGAIRQFTRNVDYLLIGKLFGLNLLGLYRVAFDLAMIPATTVAQVVNKFAMPINSKLSLEKDKLRQSFFWTMRNLALLLIPVAVLLTFQGNSILSLLNKTEWQAASALLVFLSWAGVIRALIQLFPELYNAVGKPQIALLESVLSLLVISIMLFSISWGFSADLSGLEMICVGWVPALLVLLWVNVQFSKEFLNIQFGDLLIELYRPILIAMFLCMFSLFFGQVNFFESTLVEFGIFVVLLLGFYFASLRFVMGLSLNVLFGRHNVESKK